MPTITFSEFARGTQNPVYQFEDTTVSFQGYIVGDNAQPNTPVIAGSASGFQGGVFFEFSAPVAFVSLDAGYFNDIGSTRVVFRDSAGQVIEEFISSEIGIQNFSFASDIGIASVTVIDIFRDAAGFSVDTIEFGDVVGGLEPPLIEFLSNPTGFQAFGATGAGEWEDQGVLAIADIGGFLDAEDVYKFSLDYAANVTISVSLVGDPDNVRDVSMDLGFGDHFFRVSELPDYNESLDYQITYSVTPDPERPDGAIAEFLNGMGAYVLGVLNGDGLGIGLDVLEFSSEYAAEFRAIFNTYEEQFEVLDIAEDYFEDFAPRLTKSLGVVGKLLDLSEAAELALDQYRAGASFEEAASVLYGKAVSAVVGLVVTAGATAGGAVVGATFTGPFAALVAPGAGLVANIVYEQTMADRVADTAEAIFLNALTGNPLSPAEMAAIASLQNPETLIDFDEAYYLSTYQDAQESILNGEYPTAYVHFVLEGAGLGYSPNAGGVVLNVEDLGLPLAQGVLLAGRPAVLTAELFTFAHDGISLEESSFLFALNSERTTGDEVNVDATLQAIANRVAQDAALNQVIDPILAQALGDLPLVGFTWSDGAAYEAGLDGAAQLGTNVFVLATEGFTAAEALDAFLTQFDALTGLLGSESRSVGIAEFNGVWAIVTSPNEAVASPELDSVSNDVRTGSLEDDSIIASSGDSLIDALAGDDIVFGNGGDDQIFGGDGDDRIDGGSGFDLILGGNGNDTLSAGKGNDATAVEQPDIDVTGANGNISIETAISLDGTFDLEADVNVSASGTIPSTTVNGVGGGDGQQFYSFTVSEAGATATFDIDGGQTSDLEGSFDAILRLYDSEGNEITRFDDANIDAGSESSRDSFGIFEFDEPGTYYIGVGDFFDDPLADGSTYQLHVSLSSADVEYVTQIEQLFGEDGNDTLIGGGNNDRLDGGAGRDVLSGGDGDDELIADAAVDVSIAQGQVYRLYLATLGREPDANGFRAWVDVIEDGIQSFADVAAGFVGSSEFQSVYGDLTDSQFVTLLYNNVLNRDPDPAGLQGWLNALADGTPRESVVIGFSQSPEFVESTFDDQQLWTIDSLFNGLEGQVFRLYQATLGRGPDPVGFEGWLGVLEDTGDYLGIATGFVGSLEFQNVYGSLNDEDFVTLLYNNVLGRAPVAAEVAGWISAIDNGASREEVVRGFAESAENRSNTSRDVAEFLETVIFDGSDILEGGAGDDMLFGGRGADTYIFRADDGGSDTVFTVEDWDTIVMIGFDFSDADGFASNLTQTGADVVFENGESTITFMNTNVAQIVSLLDLTQLTPAPVGAPAEAKPGAASELLNLNEFDGAIESTAETNAATQTEFDLVEGLLSGAPAFDAIYSLLAETPPAYWAETDPFFPGLVAVNQDEYWEVV